MKNREKKERKPVSKVRKWIDRLIFLVALCVFIYAAFNLGQIFFANYKEDEEITRLRDEVNAPDTDGDLDNFKVDFEKLQKINPKVVGWIIVKDTSISYPVVQGDDNTYYLDHTFSKETNYAGAIFMDSQADATLKTPYQNVFIYGHNVYHGTMFAELEKYCDKESGKSFYKKHPYVYYYTPNGNYKLKIFSTYVSTADNGAQKDFDEVGYKTYIDDILKKARYDTGVKMTSKDKMITLYTCSYENNEYGSANYDDNKRYYVHCKLIKALDGQMPYNN